MGRALVAALVGIGFVLQQLVVPLHLAQNDHVHGGAREPHVPLHVHSHGPGAHGHDGHRHDRGLLAPGGSEPDHEPHPAADHLDQLAEPALPQTPADLLVAPAPAGAGIVLLDGPALSLAERPEPAPRPPPPRDAAAPRAPPIVV